MENSESCPPNLPATNPCPKITIRLKSPSPIFISPRLDNITRSRLRSRSCMPSPHSSYKLPPNSAICLPVSFFNQRMLSVSKGMVGVYAFSVSQIQFFDKFEQHIYIKLDFACYSDHFICGIIGSAPSNSPFIPLRYK